MQTMRSLQLRLCVSGGEDSHEFRERDPCGSHRGARPGKVFSDPFAGPRMKEGSGCARNDERLYGRRQGNECAA